MSTELTVTLWIESPMDEDSARYVAGDFAKDLARRTIQARVAVAAVAVKEVTRDEIRAFDPEFNDQAEPESGEPVKEPKRKPRARKATKKAA